MKKILLFFFILTALLSCGDNSQDKATKRICDGFAEKIDVDKERCFKDKEYFKKLRFQSDVALQIEKILKFNENVDKFNSINIGINEQGYSLVNIVDFTNKNKINDESSSFRLSDDLDRKNIKFKSYFEITLPENTNEYVISFYNKRGSYFYNTEKKEEIPDLSSAKFQNIEIKKKFETIMKRKYGSRRFHIPINNESSTIYGYFINTEYHKANMSELLLLLDNKDFKAQDIEKTAFFLSEFYITDIKLEKISYQKIEVEDFVKKNKFGIILDDLL